MFQGAGRGPAPHPSRASESPGSRRRSNRPRERNGASAGIDGGGVDAARHGRRSTNLPRVRGRRQSREQVLLDQIHLDQHRVERPQLVLAGGSPTASIGQRTVLVSQVFIPPMIHRAFAFGHTPGDRLPVVVIGVQDELLSLRESSSAGGSGGLPWTCGGSPSPRTRWRRGGRSIGGPALLSRLERRSGPQHWMTRGAADDAGPYTDLEPGTAAHPGLLLDRLHARGVRLRHHPQGPLGRGLPRCPPDPGIVLEAPAPVTAEDLAAVHERAYDRGRPDRRDRRRRGVQRVLVGPGPLPDGLRLDRGSGDRGPPRARDW